MARSLRESGSSRCWSGRSPSDGRRQARSASLDPPVRVRDFRLERYFARWEFTAPHVLCASDAETFRLDELLPLADEETAELWRNLTLGYTEWPGHPLLREEIAALYTGLDPAQVLVFSGAEEGIFAFMNAALAPGDHAIVTWPAYQSLYELARAAGAEVTPLELEQESGWALDLERLRRAVREETRVIGVNFPHNPTGALPDRATFEALVEVARDAGAHLFSDEVYRGLEIDDADRLPPALEWYDRAVCLGVMSKVFGLGGLRIGWVAARDPDLLSRMAALKDYTTICNSAPSEILALIALRARERILARNRAIASDNLALLDGFFATWADAFQWARPPAGTVAFPRLRGEVGVDEFCQELLEAEGVLLLPGSVYEHRGNHFRIGFGRRRMPEGLARVDHFLGAREPLARR